MIGISYAYENTLLGLKQAYFNVNAWNVRLYTACATAGGLPSGASIVGDFTEATFPGYGPIALGAFGAPFTNGQNIGEMDGPKLTWIQTANAGVQNILGYYVTDGAGNLVYGDDNAAGATPMQFLGDTYSVKPLFTEQGTRV